MKVAYMMEVEVKIHLFLTSALQSEWPAWRPYRCILGQIPWYS